MKTILLISTAVFIFVGEAASRGVPDCVCTKELDLVCGTDGRTFANPCVARCNETPIAFRGRCDGKNERWPKRGSFPRCACTKELNWVCGVDGRNYGNPCEAECFKVQAKHMGPCQGSRQVRSKREMVVVELDDEVPREECPCPRVYFPVCGQNGITYENPCEAGCGRTTIKHEGPCAYEIYFPRD